MGVVESSIQHEVKPSACIGLEHSWVLYA